MPAGQRQTARTGWRCPAPKQKGRAQSDAPFRSGQ